MDSRIQESLLTILQTSPEPEIKNVEPVETPQAEEDEEEEKGKTEAKVQPSSLGIKNLLSDQTNDDGEKKICKSAEVEKRAEYLRAQRDKIIALRAKERTEHIAKYIKGKGKDAVSGPEQDPRPETSSGKKPLEEETNNNELAYRKSLAARLKAEIGGFNNEK